MKMVERKNTMVIYCTGWLCDNLCPLIYSSFGTVTIVEYWQNFGFS